MTSRSGPMALGSISPRIPVVKTPESDDHGTSLRRVLLRLRELLEAIPVGFPDIVPPLEDGSPLQELMEANMDDWLAGHPDPAREAIAQEGLHAHRAVAGRARRAHVHAVKSEICVLMNSIGPALITAHARHDVGRDWRTNFDAEGRVNPAHDGTGQAKCIVISRKLSDTTALEAWLWCDYLCARCRGEALRLIDALVTSVSKELGGTETGAVGTAHTPVRKPRDTRERILLAVHHAVESGQPLQSRAEIARAAECAEETVSRLVKGEVHRHEDGYHVTQAIIKKMQNDRLLPSPTT
jgi:hypothetical protein